MGRFYKTTDPQMIDFMYKVPEKAIMTAIQGADKQINAQQQLLTDLEKYLDLNVMASDVDRKNEIIDEAEKKIQEFSFNLHNDKLGAIQKMGEIRKFAKDLHENYTRGELGNMASMKKAEEEWITQETERTMKEKGQVLQSDIEKFKKIFRDKYDLPQYDEDGNLVGYAGGLKWNPETKKGENAYMSERLANYVDIQDVVMRKTNQWKADEVLTNNTHIENGYIVSDVTKEKIASYNDILYTGYNMLMDDEQVRAYYDQKIKNGILDWTEVYGERYPEGHPNQGQLVVVMTKNEKGELVPKKNKYGEPVYKNAGLIYDAAKSNAERLGFVETEEGRKAMTETAALKEQLKLNRAKAEHDYKNPTITLDTVEDVNVSLHGTDINSFEALNEKLSLANEEVKTKGKKVLNDILTVIRNADNYDPTHINNVEQLWTDAEKLNTDDAWKKVEDYLTQNHLVGVSGKSNGQNFTIGTGVRDYLNSVKAMRIEIQNQQTYVNAINRDAAISVLKEAYGNDWDRLDISAQNDIIEAFIDNAKDPKYSTIAMNQRGSVAARNVSAEKFRKNRDGIIASNSNKSLSVPFLGGAELTEGSEEDKAHAAKQLAGNSKPKRILNAFGSAPVVILEKGQAVPGSFDELISKYGFTGNYIESTDSESSSISNKNWQLTTSEMTVSPVELNIKGLSGINHKKVEVIFTKLDSEGNPTKEKVKYTVIGSGDHIKLDDKSENLFRNNAARKNTDAFKAQTDKKYESLKTSNLSQDDKENYYEINPLTGFKYYPLLGDDGTWEIGKSKLMGNDGKEAHIQAMKDLNVYNVNTNYGVNKPVNSVLK